MRTVSMTAQQYAELWKNGLTSAVQKTKDGVNRVQENPMQKAAARADAYLAGVQRAVQSNRWQNGLNAVDLQSWKTITMQKVGERLAGGAAGAVPKMQKFGAWLIPAVNNASQAIDGMPKLNLQDSINRMVTFVTTMAANPYKG